MRGGAGAGSAQELTADRPWSPHRQQDVESPTLARKGPAEEVSSLGVGGVPGLRSRPEGCFLGGVSCSDRALNLLLLLEDEEKEGEAFLTPPCWAPAALSAATGDRLLWGVLRWGQPTRGRWMPLGLPPPATGSHS